jgi:ribosomal protein L7/L12
MEWAIAPSIAHQGALQMIVNSDRSELKAKAHDDKKWSTMEVLNIMAINTFETNNIDHADSLVDDLPVSTPLSLLDRENVTVPICPIEVPSDEVLYSDPASADTFYYLPRYELVREEVSGEPRYRIEMIDSSQGWALIIFIEPYIAESLIPKVNDATALAHTMTASISYTKSGDSIVREFDEIEDQGDGKRLTMNLTDIEQRDDIFTALSTHEFSTSLVIERKIDVATPVQVDAPTKPPSTATASVTLTKLGNKIGAIKVVRMWTGAGLAKSKQLVEQRLPAILASGLPNDRALAFAKQLNDEGSVATAQVESAPQHPKPDAKTLDAWLTHAGNNVSDLLIILEKFAGIKRSEGKDLLDKPLPAQILTAASFSEARMLAAQLQKIGAKASFKASKITARVSFLSPLNTIKPILEFVGFEDVNIRGTLFTRYYVSVKNTRDIPDDLFLASPDLPPCGQNTNSSRTWIDISDQDGKRLYGYCAITKSTSLGKLSFSLKKGSVTPKSVQIVLNDRRKRKTYKSNLVPLESLPKDDREAEKETKYQIRQNTCRQHVAPTPFHFDARLHSYIYRFLGNQGSTKLIRHELQFNGSPHSYYIDANQRHVIYFFPDKFKVARWDRPPFAARMSVQINSREDESGISDVVMSYLAAPVVDQQRLVQAAAVFAENLQSNDPDIDLQPYPVVDYSFHVSHPTSAGNRSADQDIAANAFYQGIHNTLLMELPDFIPCFAALTSQTAASFHGTVSVTVGDDEKVHIPFIADLADLSGKLFDHAVLEDGSGNVSLTLINSIESSLNIDDLSIELERDSKKTDTHLESTPEIPCLLAPGESLSLELIPNTVLEGNKPLKALLDTSNIEVVLDDVAAFNSIIDRSTTEYFRMITVRVVPMLFKAKEGREAEQVVGLIVHVEGSQGIQSIELDIDNLEASARVDYSVDDLVLRDETSISYRYWYQIARANGRTETIQGGEGETQRLFLDVSRVIEGDSQ